MRTILWYDLETFGLNPRYDRIAQAAMIRTDMNLNIVGEPILLYSKLSPDYLPSPSSCMVTHITPQEVNEKGIPEAEFIGKIREEMMVPDTITAGYNNVKFDDECIRATLYRNLYDPFEREYKNRCSRWDLINLVRATRDLRPDGINFTKLNPETGTVSFKLTDLTEENNIEQVGAHDALVDVYATIDVARLIKEKQPKLFLYALNHRYKKEVIKEIDVLRGTPFLYTSALFASEKGATKPLLPIFQKENSPEIYCFDLTHPIPDVIEADYEKSGIVKVATNRCPFVAPLSTLDEKSEERLGFTKEEAIERAEIIKRKRIFNKAQILSTIEELPKEEVDVDLALYGTFATEHDKATLEKIRQMKPEEKLKSGEHLFDDDKYHKLLWRQVARCYPEALSEQDKAKWKNFCALRLLQSPTQEGLTYDKYIRSVEELLTSLDTSAEDKMIALKLKDYGKTLYETILS